MSENEIKKTEARKIALNINVTKFKLIKNMCIKSRLIIVHKILLKIVNEKIMINDADLLHLTNLTRT